MVAGELDVMELQRQPAENPDDGFLYHYTSLEAFTNIVKTKTLRASEIHYLNDTSEQIIVKGLLAKRISAQPWILDSRKSKLLAELLGPAKNQIFVACFSEDKGDRLSQWRGYGNQFGVSIGFSKAKLEHCAESALSSNVFALERVEYVSPEGGDDKIEGLIEFFLNRVQDHHDIDGEVTIWGARFKHETFSEEKEWRLLVLSTEVEYRARGSLLVPYVALDFKNELRDIVSSVRVGPIPHQEQTAISIKRLLEREGFKAAEVLTSRIPYRGF